MATLSKNKGSWLIQWRDGRKRRTLRVGRVGRNGGSTIRSHVEHLLAAKASGLPIPQIVAAWLGSLEPVMYGKLVAARLAEPRADKVVMGLGKLVDAYIARRTDLKERSRINLIQAKRTMVEFFGENRDPRMINRGEAGDWARHLRSTLAPPTVSAHVKRARQIFRDAIDRNLADTNPFDGIKLGKEVNAARAEYVLAATIDKVIDACPDAEWRLIFAMARFAGLRIPSEIRLLKWSDVNFAKHRMVVHSPKTEHHQGHGQRVVPIFSGILEFLQDCREIAPADTEFVITRHRGENLRTQAKRIIAKAGIVQWMRLFQNLRASCETDLAAAHPLHVACAWIGNSQLVAARHYLQVTDEHFAKATGSAAPSAVDHTGLAQTANGGNGGKTAANAGMADSHYPRQDLNVSKNPRQLMNWSESALRRALRKLKDAAPVIRAADIARLRTAVDAAKGAHCA